MYYYHPYFFSDKKMGIQRNEIICSGHTANECDLLCGHLTTTIHFLIGINSLRVTLVFIVTSSTILGVREM